MTTDRPSSTMPILLGMGLSLLVLFLVVGRADAATDCDLCKRNANLAAQDWCAANINTWQDYWPTPEQRMANCVYTKGQEYVHFQCENTGRCPGGGTLNGETDCASAGCRMEPSIPSQQCGDGADLNAGAICDNTCWGRPCNSSTGNCGDRIANAPKSKISLCHSQCGCGN